MENKTDTAVSLRAGLPILPVLLLGLGLALVLTLITTGWAAAGETPQETEEYCLSCHSNPDLSITLPSGEELSLFVDPEVMQGSLHSSLGIECQACHTDITTYPHPEISYQNHRELSRSYYQSCQKCHGDQYDKTLDSMHATVAEQGHPEAPVCTDCHGAHNVRPIDEPRAHISETCGECHTQIFDTYRDSVHGAALIQEDNQDVPVCTDCHGVHSIQDPRTVSFHVDTPEMCAGCHANEELMSKYNLPANVYDIYKLSWHGIDVSVYQARWPTIWHQTAVCTDCHGIHNIYKTIDARSTVNETNLLATCKNCHPDAGPNWTGAWTGHHEVSLERTPFVFYTNAFYTSFTPFVLGLSGFYVILQAIRAILERAKRSL